MAVAYDSAGAVDYSTGNPTPGYPTTIAANDLLVLVVGTKPETATPTGPGGSWQSLSGGTGGQGTQGIDTGPMRVDLWYLVATGTETGTLTVTCPSNNVSAAQIFRFTGVSTWDVAAAFGDDSTTGTAWSAACTSNPGISTGDVLLFGGVIPTDVSTPNQFSSESVTGTGLTLGTVTEIVEWDTSTGQDMGGFICSAPVTASLTSGNPTVTATAGGTTTNVAGPAFVLRVRQGVLNATVTGLATVPATSAIPDLQGLGPWIPFVTNDAGITDAGQSVESGEWVGPWWPATVPVVAAIPEVTVSTGEASPDATVTGLSAVAGVAAVPAPTPRVVVPAVAVAGVAAVPAPTPRALVTAAVVAGVAAVPAPLSISTSLTAAPVVATTAVPAPTPRVLVAAAVVAGVAAVPTPTPRVAVPAVAVAGVAAVPAPLSISAGLSVDVVAGTASVPAPASIISSSGLSVDADLAAGTDLEAEALLSGLTAVAVTAVGAVPAVGVSAGLTTAVVAALGAVPQVALSTGLSASTVAGVAAVPAPARLSAGLAAATVAGVAAVPAPARLSAGLRAAVVAGVASVPSVLSPAFLTVTNEVGVTDAGQDVQSGQWTGPWWPATVLAFATVPEVTVSTPTTQDATVTGLSAVAGSAAIPTPGVSAGLTAAVVAAVATAPTPLGLSAGLSASVVTSTAAVPNPVLRVAVPAMAVTATAAVSAPTGISAGLSPLTVAGAATVPAPAGITAESASSVEADLVAGTALVADAAITALTAVVVTATAAIPAPVPSVAVAAAAVVATAAVPTVGLSVGLSASTVAGVASVPAPLRISAGLSASVVTGVADVPAPAGITAQVSPVITDGEGITDAGQTIDRATGVTDAATATEVSAALNRGYEGADSVALASSASLGVAVAGTEAGTLAESVQVDAEGLQTFEGSDSAVLAEETALGFVVETSDDAGVSEDDWQVFDVTEVPEDDAGLADSYFIQPSASDLGTLVDGPYTLNIPSSASDAVGTLSEATTLQIGDLRGVTSTDQHNLTDVAAIESGQASVDSATVGEGAVVLERSSEVTDSSIMVEESAYEFAVQDGDTAALVEETTTLEVALDQTEDVALSVENADAGPKGFYGDVDSAVLAEGDVAQSALLDAAEEALLDEASALDQGYASADSATIVEGAIRGFTQDVVDALDLVDEATPETIGSIEVEGSDLATLDEATDLVTGIEQIAEDAATLAEDTDLFYEIPAEDLATLAESVAIEVLLVAVDAGTLFQFTNLFGPEAKPYARNGKAVLLPSPGLAPVLSATGARAQVTTVSGRARVVSGPGKVQIQSVPSIYTRADEP